MFARQLQRLRRLFGSGAKAPKRGRVATPPARRLMIEDLEQRMLLSVAPIDLSDAVAAYPNLDPTLLNLVQPVTVSTDVSAPGQPLFANGLLPRHDGV